MEPIDVPAGTAEVVTAEAAHTGSPPAARPGPSQFEQPAATPRFVFALGQVEPRFASLAAEKEYAQIAGQVDTSGQTDREVMQSVLADRSNRYLVRQLCWVLTVEGMETYVLIPRDPSDYDLLLESVRRSPARSDVDVVIGLRGPIAPAESCNGLMVPMVAFDQLYSFDRDELIQAIPRPESIGEDQEERFRAASGELFDRIMQLADNAGATDEHRALNYLAVRYPAIYARTAEAHAAESSLTAVTSRPSRLSGVRRIVDIIFDYTDRRSDVTEKYFVRVDISEEFPFLVSRLAPYYDRF